MSRYNVRPSGVNRIKINDKMWATMYKRGWTVYHITEGVLAMGLTKNEAINFQLINEVWEGR